MLEIIRDQGKDNFDFLQTCIFGLGVIATRQTDNFALLPSVLQAIEWMLQREFKNEKGEVNTCKDNGISTLGKCVYYHHSNPLITPQIVETFLSKLPLKIDSTEAKATHLRFFKEVLGGN